MSSSLQHTLEHYLSLPKPGFAILVAGPWGVGKTYQVLESLKQIDHCFISLFGVGTPTDAHRKVAINVLPKLKGFKQLFDKLNQIDLERNRFSSWFSVKLSRYFDLLSSLFSSPQLAVELVHKHIDENFTLVFDDVERSGMTLEEIFGVFSTYLDLHKCRVILIADEDRLRDIHEGYPNAKEKIVGQTIYVEPLVDQAYDIFSSDFSGRGRLFFENNKKLILRCFRESESSSLRILKQLLVSLARLESELMPEHLSHSVALPYIICEFCSISLELQLGRISVFDLVQYKETIMNYNKMQPLGSNDYDGVPNIVKSFRRYSGLDWPYMFFDNHAVEDMFKYGNFDQQSILRSIEKSRYFSDAIDIPNWYFLSNPAMLDDDTIAMTIKSLESDFINRKIIHPGEMSTMFCLRLFLSKHDVINHSIEEVEAQCIEYIHELRESQRMHIDHHILNAPADWPTHFGVTGITLNEINENIARIFDHLRSAVKAAVATWLDRMGKTLVSYARKGYMPLHIELEKTLNAGYWQSHVLTLECIDAVEFVDALLSSPKKHWNHYLITLDVVLNPSGDYYPSKRNALWLINVIDVLHQRYDNTFGSDRLRIIQLITEIENRIEKIELL